MSMNEQTDLDYALSAISEELEKIPDIDKKKAMEEFRRGYKYSYNEFIGIVLTKQKIEMGAALLKDYFNYYRNAIEKGDIYQGIYFKGGVVGLGTTFFRVILKNNLPQILTPQIFDLFEQIEEVLKEMKIKYTTERIVRLFKMLINDEKSMTAEKKKLLIHVTELFLKN